MKYRDPNTGEVFEEIEAARIAFCGMACQECKLSCWNNKDKTRCDIYCHAHPAEAARLMGLEVVEDKPAADSEKSLFCEHIGVSPGQPFIVRGYPYRNYAPMVYGEDGCVRLYAPDGQKRHKIGGRAITWMVDHPERVEPCVGYTPQEVAFKKEEPMEKKEKPRICQVLRVEVGEKFTYPGMIGEFWITENGHLRSVVDDDDNKLMTCVPTLINHPDRIIRKPRFTEEEVADAKEIARILWDAASLTKYANGVVWIYDNNGKEITRAAKGLFPSLRPGQAAKLEEIIG